MNKKIWYINIKIINYDKFDQITKLIELIDNNIINQLDIIPQTTYNIIWSLSNNIYDYKSIIPSKYSDDLIIDYINNKILNIQDIIKYKFKNFGKDWSIDVKITNYDYE